MTILYGSSGADRLTGSIVDDNIFGWSGNDTINGGAGNDHLYGDSGGDLVIGGPGLDFLYGGEDHDTLKGRSGNDTLTGGLYSDQFHFDMALPVAGVDRINDFEVRGDKIVLDKRVFSALETLSSTRGNPLVASDLTLMNVAATLEFTEAGNNSDEIVYNVQTGSLFYNPNNAAAGFGRGGGRFAILVGSPDNLSATDFLVMNLT